MRICKIISIYKKKIADSNLGNRIVSGAFWSFTGTAAAKFFVLLAGITTAHILNKDNYGELGIIRSTVNTFIVFASMGLGLTASKYIAEYRDSQPFKVGDIYMITSIFAVLIGGCVAISIYFFADVIAIKSLNAPHLVSEIRYGVILLFFSALNGAQIGILSGFENFKSLAKNTLFCGILEFTLLTLGAYYIGIKGAVLGSGVSYFVFWILNKISINKCFIKYNITYSITRLKRNDFSIIWKFSIPAALANILVLPVLWYAKTILVKRNGFSEMAMYDIAEQWRIIILFIPSALSSIVLPILSNIYASGKKEKYVKVLKLNLLFNLFISSCISILVILIGNFILSFYGSLYTNVYPLVILSLSTIFAAGATVVGQAIASRAKMWIGLLFNLLWAFEVILFTYFFTGKGYGSTGLAIAILFSYILHFFSQYIYIRILLLHFSNKNVPNYIIK